MADSKFVRFGIVDYAVFAVMLLLSTCIGVYHALAGGRQKTTREFLLANRSMMSLPVAISLLASFMSAITILGVPAEIYTFGTEYWFIVVSYVLLFPITAHVFVPVFHGLNITSAYEYLEKRFATGLRIIGSCFFILQTCLYMAIVVYGPSIALQAVTGFPIWISIISIGAVCTFYTTIGGIKAVIWNDVFQAIVMLAGLVAIIVVGSNKVGGFANVWDIMEKGQRLKFMSASPDPTQRLSVWSLLIGGAFGLFPLWAVNQTAVQRFLAAKSLKDAKMSVWVNLPLSVLAVSLCALCGCVIYATYHDCDPKSLGLISKGDQILPYFVMHVLGSLHGVPGLFMACLFSGTLSTVSSGLNSLAAVVLEDIVKPFTKHRHEQLTEAKATLYSKLLAFMFGLLTIGLSFLAQELGAILQTFYRVFGVVGGPMVGVFSLGMLTRRAHTRGAYIGLLAGFAMGLWIGIGAQLYPPPLSTAPVSVAGCLVNTSAPLTSPLKPNATAVLPKSYEGLGLYRLSFLWYSAVCFTVTFAVGLLVSVVWPGQHDRNSVDPKLLFHFCRCAARFNKKDEEMELHNKTALNTDYKEEESDLTKQKEGSQHLVHGTRDSTAPLYVSNA